MERIRAVPRPRPAASVLIGAGLTALATTAMVPFRGRLTLATPALVLVLPIVAAGWAGGRGPALAMAVTAAAVFNLAFIPPHWTFKVDSVDDLVALVVFAVVAAVVGTLVARERDRRKAAEHRAHELAAVNVELVALQEERARLAEEATRAAVLERVDEQRAALLRSVSHDLRTPLSTIRAVASDLLSEVAYDPETRTKLLALVVDEAERLDRLVANLLSLSRIEAGALRPERQAVDMEELITNSVRRLNSLLRGVRVQVELPRHLPLADGDYTQVDQVLANLFENAARHAPAGSTIRVGARLRRELVEVWVDDEGAGVSPFERQRIFEPFRRGEGSTSSGIGLAICKAIVEAHGGHIEVTSAAGGGARFAFSLPVHDA